MSEVIHTEPPGPEGDDSINTPHGFKNPPQDDTEDVEDHGDEDDDE
jgi:hypothetical protein